MKDDKTKRELEALRKEREELAERLAQVEKLATDRLRAYETALKRGLILAEKLDEKTKELNEARDAAQVQADELARLMREVQELRGRKK